MTFSIENCRELLESDSEELNNAFVPIESQELDTRKRYCANGTVELALDIIKRDSLNHKIAIAKAWSFFHTFLPIHDVDNEEENKPIEKFVELDGIRCLANYLHTLLAKQLGGVDDAMFMLAWCATVDVSTPHIIAHGAHKPAIGWIKEGDKARQFDISMSFIRAASACHSTRSKLREDGALEAVIPHLEGLKKADDLSLRRGFRAASVVARLAGNDEQGVGPQILRGNPVLIDKMLEIFSRVLDAGPRGAVISMAINPHFITMDLLTISTSDVNKPLLKNAIHILVRALKVRGETNEQMVVDIVKTLLQLSFDKECFKVMVSFKDELTGLLQQLITAPKYDMEALLSSQNLRNVLNLPVSETKTRKLGGIVRRVMMDSSSRTVTEGKERRRSSAAAGGQKHVMLSYNWGVKPIVQKVDELLRANGVKTWVDDRDMGPNLNDSMAQAIEGAGAVFVFITAKYKESANCRKECEYADDFKIPITYIMAEENYKPNGWLGLQVGKAVWIPCWLPEHPEANLQQLLQRAHAGIAASSSSVSAKPPLVPTSSAVTAKASSNVSGVAASSDVLETLKAMQAQLAAMQTTMDELKSNQEKLAETVNLVKTSVERIAAAKDM